MSSTPTSAPLIGVPCGLQYPPESPARPLHTVRESYLHALVQAGAMPLILPLIEDEEKLRTAYERLDGLPWPVEGTLTLRCMASLAIRQQATCSPGAMVRRRP
jgi:hypothetical protein